MMRQFLIALIIVLFASVANAGQVTLAWDANDPAPDGYRVFVRAEGDAYDYATPAWPTDGQVHTETTCTLDDLTDGVTYYFVVRAFVGSEESGDSNEVAYTVAGEPQIIYIPKRVASVSIDGTVVSWQAADDEPDSFKVYLATFDGTYDSVAYEGDLTTFDLAALLQDNTKYKVCVVAVKNGVDSAKSQELAFTHEPPMPVIHIPARVKGFIVTFDQ